MWALNVACHHLSLGCTCSGEPTPKKVPFPYTATCNTFTGFPLSSIYTLKYFPVSVHPPMGSI